MIVAMCHRRRMIFVIVIKQYLQQKRLIKALNIPPKKAEQTFQSRLGRDPWLNTVYTAVRLTELPKEGIKKLLLFALHL